MSQLFVLGLAMLAAGAVGGILAGLLGIGGGIVIVPALEVALSWLGVDEAIRMHVAVATSLATIIPTSMASSRAHHLRRSVDLELARRWTGFVFIGALAGTVVAAQVHSRFLAALFGVMTLVIAVKMALPLDGRTLARAVPRGALMAAVPAGIGGISSMMGIGGGTFSVAVLTLCNQPIHRAVGTAALFGLAISLPGTLGFVVAGWADPRLPPGSLGYVNLLGFALIAPATVLMAPVGAALAHKLPQRRLSLLFAVFLAIVSLRMFWRAL